ncbi:hypothetical protein [Acidovorax sp.]|uniref:hypothetical protein n=1 Tax=Acidovorax sp. TaxID=1872122 RepID=UPI00258BBF68|nr:hypothetical protein [Acidovorax sp.]
MQMQEDIFQALMNEIEASFVERADSRKKELAAEIAEIEAAERSCEEIVFELAVARLNIRRLKEQVKMLNKTREKYIAHIKSMTGLSERQINAHRKQLNKLDDRIREVVALLPRAFEEGKKTIAVRGAAARHKENRAIKQDVFAWLDANPPKPRGKDAAATEIVGSVVPVTFRTARKWIDEWENLRATGTV